MHIKTTLIFFKGLKHIITPSGPMWHSFRVTEVILFRRSFILLQLFKQGTLCERIFPILVLCQLLLNLFYVIKCNLSYWSVGIRLPVARVYGSRAPVDPVSAQITKGQRDQYFSILVTSYKVTGPHLLGSSTVTIKWLRSSTYVY